MSAGSAQIGPYPGPRPFEEKERDLFYGREREESELLSLTIAHRTILIHSQSGVGKTSLLKAGVGALLRAKGADVLPVARVHAGLPQGVIRKDISNLYVFNTLISWAQGSCEPATLKAASLNDYLRSRARPTSQGPYRTLRVVIFDPFEELFNTYPDRWRDREPFFEQMREAIEADSNIRVLMAIREEYLAEFEQLARTVPGTFRTRYRLERLGLESAVRAVVEPAAKMGRTFEPEAAKSLVTDLMKIPMETDAGTIEEVPGPWVEAVHLQVVCRQLWRRLPQGTARIGHTEVKECGGVDEALATFYDETVAEAVTATGTPEILLRRWFGRTLVTPMGTRGTVHRGVETTSGLPNQVVDMLQHAHLVRAEERAGAVWYELTHDRIIRPIREANERWFRKQLHAEQARVWKHLEERARAWSVSGRASELLREGELREAENLLAKPAVAAFGLGEPILELIRASQAEQQRGRVTQLEALAEEQARRAEAERTRAEATRKRARTERWLAAAVLGVIILLTPLLWSGLNAAYTRVFVTEPLLQRVIRPDGGKDRATALQELYGRRYRNFAGLGLQSIDLHDLVLPYVDFSRADLTKARLAKADLGKANLGKAILSEAILASASLREADLSGANLTSAKLSGANLSGANLSGANLSDVDLLSANLSNAGLERTRLTNARMREARLDGARFDQFPDQLVGLDLTDTAWWLALGWTDGQIQEFDSRWPQSAYRSSKALALRLGEFDADVDRATDDQARAVALNARAWDQAIHGVRLEKALADAEEAINLLKDGSSDDTGNRRDLAAALDTRGYIRMQFRQYREALGDFQAAVQRLSPEWDKVRRRGERDSGAEEERRKWLGGHWYRLGLAWACLGQAADARRYDDQAREAGYEPSHERLLVIVRGADTCRRPIR